MKDLMSGRLALFSSDNKYLLGATSKAGVKVWELSAQPTEVLTIPTPDGVSRIGFAPGANKFFVSQRNGSITIWDIDTRQRISTAVQDDLSSTPFLQKDGRYLVLVSSGGFSGGGVEKRALDTGLKVGEMRLNSTGRPTFIYSDGDSVLLLADSIVRLWDVPPLKEQQWLSRIAKNSPFSAKFSGDGNTLLMVRGELTKEATFQLLNVNEQKEILPPFKTTYRGYELSPDGSRIMLNMDGNTVNLYDRTRPESKNPLNFARSPIQGVFSPDSRIFALATDDNQVHLIDTTKGVTQRSFTTNVRPSSMVFSHNNEYLLVGTVGSFIESDNPFMDYDKTTHTVEVRSVTNGQSTNFNLDERARVEAVAISNERIAMFQNQKILVFNLGGGKIMEFDYGLDLAFLSISPDRKFIVTSDRKGLIQLWNADSGMARRWNHHRKSGTRNSL